MNEPQHDVLFLLCVAVQHSFVPVCMKIEVSAVQHSSLDGVICQFCTWIGGEDSKRGNRNLQLPGKLDREEVVLQCSPGNSQHGVAERFQIVFSCYSERFLYQLIAQVSFQHAVSYLFTPGFKRHADRFASCIRQHLGNFFCQSIRPHETVEGQVDLFLVAFHEFVQPFIGFQYKRIIGKPDDFDWLVIPDYKFQFVNDTVNRTPAENNTRSLEHFIVGVIEAVSASIGTSSRRQYTPDPDIPVIGNRVVIDVPVCKRQRIEVVYDFLCKIGAVSAHDVWDSSQIRICFQTFNNLDNRIIAFSNAYSIQIKILQHLLKISRMRPPHDSLYWELMIRYEFLDRVIVTSKYGVVRRHRAVCDDMGLKLFYFCENGVSSQDGQPCLMPFAFQ